MPRFVGRPNTVQELIEILEKLPPDKPVRCRTISHEFLPTVQEHERCITIDG